MKYKVVIPNWYEGVLTCEMVNGKETVIHAPKNMAWAIGKDSREALAFYRSRPGAVITTGKKKLRVVRSQKRRVIRIRRKK